MASILFFALFSFHMAYGRQAIRHEAIECDGFQTEQCTDLLYQYYGLTADELTGYGSMQQAMLADSIECHYIYDVCPFYIPPVNGTKKECIDGHVEFIDENDEFAYYDCKDVHLLSFIPLVDLGSNNNASGADIWGYQTVNEEGDVEKHYAITGQADGTSIVDVTDPLRPNVLAFIVSNVVGELRNVLWRDVKVYKDWAISVADTGSVDDHGVQLFNLTSIIESAEAYQAEMGQHEIYQVPKEDVVVYDQVGRCHNVYVDNGIGHLYAFGSMGRNGNNCSTGIHIIDIREPNNPTFMGCYDDALYVHDAHCVQYHGPDANYFGREICFMFTPDVGNLTIVDITDPTNISEISSTPYFTSSYNHQGWLTSNHEYLLLDDETDECPLPDRFPCTQNKTTTYIFDVRDLDTVDYRRPHYSEVLAVDHNQYIVDNGHAYKCSDSRYRGYTFQANYEAGLRILRVDDIANEYDNQLQEIAFFDVFPWKVDANGSARYQELKFFGAWSVYPYFNELGTKPEQHVYSPKLVVQSTTTGLYVVEFDGDMDFSTKTLESGNEFKWGSWYGYILIVAIVLASLIAIFVVRMAVCACRRRRKHRKGVYEIIVGMEETKNYGADA